VHVTELWRYPVKSMRGEPLAAVEVDAYGLRGDRRLYVVNGADEVVTARTAPGLLAQTPAIGVDGEVVFDGLPWQHSIVGRRVREIAGPDARLVPARGPEGFDVMPLSIVTESAAAVLGVDHRRLRPNIVLSGTEGLEERTWVRRALRIGEVVVAVARLRDRCVVTTWDPDTLLQDAGVLQDIRARFDGFFALDGWAVMDGTIAVHDRVELLDDASYARPPKLGRNVPPEIGTREQRL